MDDSRFKDVVFEESRKKKRYAYLLWLLFGWFGVHRIYAGKTGSGIAQMLLTFTGIGFLVVTFWWWLIDAFLVPDMVNESNLELLREINKGHPAVADGKDAPRIEQELDPRREAMLEELRQTGYRKERRDEISRLYR